MNKMERQKDNLDALIAERLAERRRKLDRMHEMECRKGKSRGLEPVSLAIAACLVGTFVLVSWPQPEEGWQDVSRSASPEIQQFLQDGEIEKALEIVATEAAEADSAIAGLLREDTTDEEIAYELQAERQKLQDLQELEEKISEKKEDRGLLRLLPCINKRK